MGRDSGCRGRVSRTITRLSTPTCGAARPTPSAAYIVSNRSFTSARMGSSTRATDEAFFFRMGSGQIRMSRTMCGTLYCRPETGATGEQRSIDQMARVAGAEPVIAQHVRRFQQRVLNLARPMVDVCVRVPRVLQRMELGRQLRIRALDLFPARRPREPKDGEVIVLLHLLEFPL